MQQKDYPTVYGLTCDVWTKIFQHLLADICLEPNTILQQKASLSQVCKTFYLLILKRQEMKAFQSAKEQWIKTVFEQITPHGEHYKLQQQYFEHCVKAIQLSAQGPEHYPQQSIVMKNLRFGDVRQACFTSLSYLECQYLYLTELALFNRNFRWSFPLLEQLKLELNKTDQAQNKFLMVMSTTDYNSNTNLTSLPNIEQEHKIYSQSWHTLYSKTTVEKEYDFRYEHHMKESKCIVC